MEKKILLFDEQNLDRRSSGGSKQGAEELVSPLLVSVQPSELQKLEMNAPLTVKTDCSPRRSVTRGYDTSRLSPVVPIQLPSNHSEDSGNESTLEAREARYSPAPLLNAQDPNRRISELEKLQNQWRPPGARLSPLMNDEEQTQTVVNMDASKVHYDQNDMIVVEGKKVKLVPPDSIDKMVLPFEAPSAGRVSTA